MWTNRATSPRVLRLNRGVGAVLRRARGPVLILGLTLLAPALFAAETTEILATGPDLKKGIPYLSANVLAYFLVTYQPPTAAAPGSPSRAAIRVLYSGTTVVPASSWKPSPCATSHLLVVDEQPSVLFFSDGEESEHGWSLFFVFPAGYEKPCSFAATFVTRFRYFLGITRNSALSSFPAVLNVP